MLAFHSSAYNGNGRVARIILDYQAQKLLGHKLSEHVGRSEYLEALKLAQGSGELTPLAKLVMQNDLNRVRCSKERTQRDVVSAEPLVSKAMFFDSGDDDSGLRRG